QWFGKILIDKCQETAAVGGGRESLSVAGQDVRFEESLGNREDQLRFLTVNGDGHDVALRRQKVKLLSILSPHGPIAAVRRDHLFGARIAERNDIDLIPSGLVRSINDPATIWREVWIPIVRRASNQLIRFAIALHRQDPNARTGFVGRINECEE